MGARPAARAGDARHDRGEAPRGGDRLARALGDQGPGDAAGGGLFAVARHDRGQLARRERVHQGGGRGVLRAVHPHVERSVLLEGESPGRVVDLLRRDAEIEEDPVRGAA